MFVLFPSGRKGTPLTRMRPTSVYSSIHTRTSDSLRFFMSALLIPGV
jgi:hypothetical protein